ncbi:hypothetical protein WH06_01660 [Aeromonas salmonicida subsp. salmonicida]|nr:hypothetical protein [Aeromonas salmonicida]AIZ49601.1 hypothetical protein [Aeromonas salmonicida subsp. salmonicida]AYO63685.1 hypothetical protein C5P03_13380 [Aeromonas salmonicida subsp. salmonicida 01-B526]EHI54358.1 hypothetical protein IYQ_01212 [Aeromonas salmonicida subsp. salmonicida 01-B526]ELI6443046.1 hypothetical protein [Aeromonas salmonicida subsp. salmonicida]KHE97408.1 hypothetical protein NX85_17840 [Aeromonas salmonicida subsp. salmonicida]
MVAITATTTPFDAKDVNDQVNKTISQDGLLMRMAKAKGEQYAAGRGLSNSSIGAEASQRAIVDAALPIASQNAGQAWKSDENRIDRGHQLTMQGNQFGHEKGMANINAQLQKERDQLLHKNSLGMLDAEGQQRLKELGVQNQYQTERDQLLHKNSLGMLDAEGQQRLKELGAQSEYQKERDQLLHKNSLGMLDAEGQQRLKELDNQNKASLDQLAQQVVANTHGMYMSTVDKAVSSYNDRYAAVMADNTMKATDKEKLVNNMKTELNSTLNMYQQMYSNISTIKPDWTKFPSASLPGVNVK